MNEAHQRWNSIFRTWQALQAWQQTLCDISFQQGRQYSETGVQSSLHSMHSSRLLPTKLCIINELPCLFWAHNNSLRRVCWMQGWCVGSVATVAYTVFCRGRMASASFHHKLSGQSGVLIFGCQWPTSPPAKASLQWSNRHIPLLYLSARISMILQEQSIRAIRASEASLRQANVDRSWHMYNSHYSKYWHLHELEQTSAPAGALGAYFSPMHAIIESSMLQLLFGRPESCHDVD